MIGEVRSQLRRSLHFGAWVAAFLIPLGSVIWIDRARIERIEVVSAQPPWSVSDTARMSEIGAPRLIISCLNDEGLVWTDQTRQMITSGTPRLRYLDYENAPFGVALDSPSPYRWWLGAMALVCHAISGNSIVAAIDQAALIADPLLLLILLASSFSFVAWRSGILCGAVFWFSSIMLFPFAATFFPGIPTDQGLALCCVLWSVLPLIYAGSGRVSGRWTLFFAGIAGGAGLWVNVADQVPILVGIGIGALLSMVISRTATKHPHFDASEAPSWRIWALGGAATTLLGYLTEYYPNHLGSWELRTIHPVYGLAWIGGGELLVRASAVIRRQPDAWKPRAIVGLVLAFSMLAALPATMWHIKSLGFLATEPSMNRLSKLADAPNATSTLNWLTKEGFTQTASTVLIPTLFALPAVWLLMRVATHLRQRCAIAVALGPLFTALPLALVHLRWWSGFDVTLLPLVVLVTEALSLSAKPRVAYWIWFPSVAAVLTLCLSQSLPVRAKNSPNTLTDYEVAGWAERDLALWLELHAGTNDAIVLAPSHTTIALHHYGGQKGIGTLERENHDGFQAAVRVLSATTDEEALDLIQRRGITHIVIPSWDNQLDFYARLGIGQIEGTLLDRISRWNIPLWLRPAPYPFPTIDGFAGHSILIFDVVAAQDEATFYSRLAEYFVETNNIGAAASVSKILNRFPGNVGALAARAQVAAAQNERNAFSHLIDTMLPLVNQSAIRRLPWDRRVAVAVLLARAHRYDLAQTAYALCVADIDGTKLRSLSYSSLYHLLVLGKSLHSSIEDPEMQELAFELLPREVRARFTN